MSIQNYLRSLIVKGWEFWLKDGALAYRAVKNDETASILAQLKDNKNELMTLLTDRPEVLDVAPVSDGQLSYWIEWQRNPQDSSAHVPFSFRIRSQVDADKLHQAINAVMAHHDALRSIFLFESGELIQQVIPTDKAQAEFNRFDVSGEDENSVRQRVIDGHKKPFELESKPPVRMDLYSWNYSDHVLMLSIHHTVIDGLSHGIVLQEFVDNYEKMVRAESINTTPATVPYSDYARWQKRLIGSQRWQEMESYWHESLDGAPTLLQLPQKAERGSTNKGNVAEIGSEKDQKDSKPAISRSVVKLNIDETLYAKLETFAREVGTTKYVTLLAAYQAAIYRYSGQRDLLIGSPLLGRTDHRFGDVVGYFINTVVLRAKMEDSQAFKALIKQTSRQILGAIDNQDYLFSHLLEKLQPERHSGATPFFQAWFNLNKYWQFSKSSQQLSATTTTDSGLVMERYDIGGQEANFDLVLLMEDNDKQLRGEIKYNADIYDQQMIEDMAQDFVAILDQVTQFPEVALSDIHLLADDRKAAADELMSSCFSLSPQQARMWRQRDLLLNRPVTLRLKVNFKQPSKADSNVTEKVDHGLLKHAIETVMNQHEIFSTQFVRHPLINSLLQKIDTVNLQFKTLTDTALTEAQVWELVQEQATRTSEDFTHAFVDCFIQDVAENTTMVVLQIHPMLVDATLATSISTQVAQCYEAMAAGNEWETEDPVQFIDIAEWTQQLLNSEDAEEGQAFWNQIPLTFDQVDALKLDKLGNRITRFNPISLEAVPLNTNLLDQLNELVAGAEKNNDMASWLLTAWQVLLSRLTNNGMHIVGMRFDGRPDEDTQTVVGPLAKFLPVLCKQSGEQTAKALTQINQTFIAEAESFQECFVWPHDTDNTSQLNVLPYQFEWDEVDQEYSGETLQVQIKPVAIHTDVFNLKLSCQHNPVKNQLSLVLHLNSEAFNVSVGHLLMQQYLALLQQMLMQPERTISELPIVDHKQHAQILAFNNETRDFATNSNGKGKPLIHRLIRQQAEKRSNKIAIVCQYNECTYGQLNELTTRYARILCDAGVQKGDFVGVFARHSSEAIIANLAILNAGAVYVPLDPEYPHDRLQYIVDDCQLKTVFVGDEVADLPLVKGITAIALNLQPEGQNPNFPEVDVFGEDGAYLIYTSGSTGKPKGTLISHGAFVDHAWSVTERFGTNEHDKVLLFAPLNFDPSIEQALTPLMRGATVQVRDQVVWQPSDIAAKVKQFGLTVINFPTAFWHLLAQEWGRNLDLDDVKTLRLVISGGDKLLPEMARLWWSLGLDNVRLLNAYGPTETTVTASTADIDSPNCVQYHQASIGKPLCNRTMYLLDKQLQPVPVGSEGELYIGGVGLATGYLNRAELTEQVFLPDPFNQLGRMYKTGDRAFYDEVGNVYFVGRVDTQVKIRGFRIEPMEIELRVNQSSLVSEAAVVIRQQGEDKDNKQIVVCFVPAQSAENAGGVAKEQLLSQLQDQLKDQLPDYMLPHQYVQLDAMPLTPSGKIAYRQLSELIENYKPEVNTSEPPQTPTELALAEIWQDLIGVEQINRFDNFSRLGGHSLLFMKLLSNIGDRFKVNLKLKEVFNAGDLASQAALIDTVLGGDQNKATPLVAIDSNKPLPLSYAQESMWLVSQLGHGMSYQMSGILHFSESLNLEILQQCVDLLIARHGALRTHFVAAESGAVQHVSPVVVLPVEVVESVTAEQEQEILHQWHHRDFDFARAPLMRVILIRCDDSHAFNQKVLNSHSAHNSHNTLGLCLHHIISDGFSTNILLNEMASLYAGLKAGKAIELEPLPIQYHDYAVWERKVLSEAVINGGLGYWQDQLSGFQDLDIMPRQNRPLQLSGKGRRIDHVVSEEVDKGLQRLCKQAGVSQTALLVATVKLLLNQYSQNKDFCLGLPTANRDRKELEGVVGMLVNILVVRMGQQDADMSLDGFLQQAHNMIQQGLLHQDVPFDKVVERLKPERDLSRNPVFQVFVSYIELNNVLQFGEEQVTFKPYDGNHARFDLSFDFARNNQGELTLALEYSSDLFAADFVHGLIENLNFIFTQFAAGNVHTIEQLQYVDSVQAQRQLRWGEGPHLVDVEPGRFNVVDLIDRSILMRTDAPALTCREQTLSYTEFGRRVNYIAAHLQCMGVSPGDFVGVSVVRSLNTSLAMIAIFKLGAVYVPIDPTLPEQRIGYILNDSDTQIVITDEFSNTNLQASVAEGVRLVVMNCNAEIEGGKADANPHFSGRLDVNQLAYVIYTSGSTGNPKGVMISLAAVTHCMFALREVVAFTSDDSMLAVATTSFDISVLDLLLPLCFGGELIIADDLTVKNADALSALITHCEATLMQATPATWEMLFESGWNNSTSARLLSIGEPISAKLHRAFEKHDCKVWNGYGPTEATIYATAKELVKGSQMSIGKAIGNYKVYILGDQLTQLPTGVPGELYIGGPGVGLGYLNQPELTAAAFIDNPFCPGEKFYKTGDLVRWVELAGEMEIEYLSRIDQQVKLRGYRIELGEVESALDEQQLFSQIAVVLKDTPTGSQLVAYLVPRNPESDVDIASVKRDLVEKIPGYMVPAYIEILDEMPLTPSKKFDKKLLCQLQMFIQGGAAFGDTTSLTETESRLLTLWQAIFKSDRIGELDNFFQLGGHSLLLVNLQNQIQQLFDIELQLADLFKAPTLRDMASVIDAGIFEEYSGNQSPKIDPNSTPTDVPLSYNQQGLWLVDKMVDGTNAYNILYGIRLGGDIRPELLLQAWQQVQQRQQSLRTYFEYSNGKALQRVSKELLTKLPVMDLSDLESAAQQDAIDNKIQAEFEYIFDLSGESLSRLHLLKLNPDSFVFLMNIHHIIFDGWSARVLISEIMTAYDALLNRGPAIYADLSLQYTDFAYWQRTYLDKDNAGIETGTNTAEATQDSNAPALQQQGFKGQLEYWQQQLRNCPELSALPFDHALPESSGFDGAVLQVVFDLETVAPLRALARRLNTTLFTVMLSGWKLLLFLETQQTDIQIGTDVANRTKPALEPLIGFFMNQVPLRTQFQPEQSVSQFIALVSQVCIDAFANQEVPFEQLVSHLNVERVGGRAPLFQGKFFMDNLPMEALQGANFSMEPLVIEQEAARLPLNFSLVDTGQQITGKLVYSTAVFESSTAERMLQRYRAILPLLAPMLDKSVQTLTEKVAAQETNQQEQARQVLREEKLKSFKSRSRRVRQST